MGRFRAWVANFMRGRYGFDELSRSMSIWVIVLLIASVVLSLLASLFGSVFNVASVAGLCYVLYQLCNVAVFVLVVIVIWRMFSRRRDKRSAENERYLERRARSSRPGRDLSTRGRGAAGSGRGTAGSGRGAAERGRDRLDHKYLTCQSCGQKMRVPRGKGRIAVKCPKCGEKTIVKS